MKVRQWIMNCALAAAALAASGRSFAQMRLPQPAEREPNPIIYPQTGLPEFRPSDNGRNESAWIAPASAVEVSTSNASSRRFESLGRFYAMNAASSVAPAQAIAPNFSPSDLSAIGVSYPETSYPRTLDSTTTPVPTTTVPTTTVPTTTVSTTTTLPKSPPAYSTTPFPAALSTATQTSYSGPLGVYARQAAFASQGPASSVGSEWIESPAATMSAPTASPGDWSAASDLGEFPDASVPWASLGAECCSDAATYHLGGLARGFWSVDSRYSFMGPSTSFVAEGAVWGDIERRIGDWQVGCRGEFFVNQPWDENILSNTPIRRSFLANFDPPPLEISQLHVAARRDDIYIAVGKIVTPFGRFYLPLVTNARTDAPFIRTESIEWRETGAVVQFDPDIWSFTLALTNGGEDRDTSASKAVITRTGLQTDWFAIGCSTKHQIAVGSSVQAVYDNQYGLDVMIRRGRVHLSAEVIYDEYGFRRPFDPLDMTWPRSLYGRDAHRPSGGPLSGVGYYLNLGCDGAYWSLTANYGAFYPQPLGDPWHDEANHRGLLKVIYHASPHFDVFMSTLIENRVSEIQPGERQGSFYGVFGVQVNL